MESDLRRRRRECSGDVNRFGGVKADRRRKIQRDGDRVGGVKIEEWEERVQSDQRREVEAASSK